MWLLARHGLGVRRPRVKQPCGRCGAEVLSTLQAAQQSTQGQVLSLQTHLRALLRKAEMERATGSSVVNRGRTVQVFSKVVLEGPPVTGVATVGGRCQLQKLELEKALRKTCIPH